MLVTLSLPARSSWNGRSYLFIYLFIPPLTAAANSLYSMSVHTCREYPMLTFFPENFSGFFFLSFEIQPIITLEGSISHTFQKEGINKVTVQVSSGGTIMQDAKVITVKGESRKEKWLNWCDWGGLREYAARRGGKRDAARSTRRRWMKCHRG